MTVSKSRFPGTDDAAPPAGGIDISIVIPLHDESGNIAALLLKLVAVMDGMGRSYEVICVDDGSSDGTFDLVARHASEHSVIKGLQLVRNFGQTAAIMAGVEMSVGDTIITMDGDGQNDPVDIPRMLARLDEGFDVVSGWRFERKDRTDRVLISRVANFIASRISGIKLRDYGCSLKAYRRQVLQNVRLYGELHRFIPIFSHWEGGRVAEIKVTHHPRQFGRSHYGYGRISKVLLDLLLIRYLYRYMHRPLHLFGGFGMLSLIGAALAGTYTFWLKFGEGVSFIKTPMPLVTIILFAVGVLSILMGFLAEIVVRTYFESQDRRPYVVRQVLSEEVRANVRH